MRKMIRTRVVVKPFALITSAGAYSCFNQSLFDLVKLGFGNATGFEKML